MGFRGGKLAVAVLGLLIVGGGTFAGCGDGGPSDSELQQARKAGAQKALKAARQARLLRDLQKQLHQIKDDGTSTPPDETSPSSSPAPAQPSSSSSLTACTDTVSVGPATTCPFAINVASAYLSSGGSGAVEAYSDATKQYYTMSCSGSAPTVCTGGDDASVYIGG